MSIKIEVASLLSNENPTEENTISNIDDSPDKQSKSISCKKYDDIVEHKTIKYKKNLYVGPIAIVLLNTSWASLCGTIFTTIMISSTFMYQSDRN